MRVAVIADIHANLPALEAVLADIATLDVDRLVVNGDIVNRGPSNAAAMRMLEQNSMSATLGNHDDLMRMWVERDPALPDEWFEDPFWASAGWAARELEQAGFIDAIRHLPMTLRITVDHAPSLLISHGSPRHYREGYGKYLTDEAISEITQMHPADVLVGSHTHRPLKRRWGHYLVLNTGAVGSPFNGDPRAQYLVLTLEAGAWVPQFRRVPYDREAALRSFETSGYVEEGGLSARIFREELRNARSYLVPFLMWCEEQGRPHEEAAWREFQRRFEQRFKAPAPVGEGVEVVAEA
ncbi:MAG: metallophosphoesterase [Deinococcales bacterium]